MCGGLKQKESNKSTSRSRNPSSKVASEDFQLHAVRGSQEEKQSCTEQTRLETQQIWENTFSGMLFFPDFSLQQLSWAFSALRMIGWTGLNSFFPDFVLSSLGPEAETVGVGAACGPLGIWALTFQAGGLAPKKWILLGYIFGTTFLSHACSCHLNRKPGNFRRLVSISNFACWVKYQKLPWFQSLAKLRNAGDHVGPRHA